MSSAIIIKFKKPENMKILGFSQYNENTLFHIGYKNLSLYEWIYTSLEGEGIYPENFSNKRFFLEFIKKNKKRLELDYFRLNKDLLENLKKLPQDFFLYLGDVDDIGKLRNTPDSLLSLKTITDKTLLKENTIYFISRH